MKELREVYGDSSQKDLKKENDIATNRKLAETLKLISEKGADVFYNSNFTDTMVQEIREEGGILTKEDFVSYKVKEKETLRVNLGNDKVLLVPPLPSGGPLLSIIISLVDQYHTNYTQFSNQETLYWHRTVESFKHAFAKQSHFGDPDFVAGANESISKILDPKNLAQLKEKILDTKTSNDPNYYGAVPNFQPIISSSTSHVSVLAPNGDAVAITSSLNTHFGSFFVSPSTGVVFNNEMEDFATRGIENVFLIICSCYQTELFRRSKTGLC